MGETGSCPGAREVGAAAKDGSTDADPEDVATMGVAWVATPGAAAAAVVVAAAGVTAAAGATAGVVVVLAMVDEDEDEAAVVRRLTEAAGPCWRLTWPTPACK